MDFYVPTDGKLADALWWAAAGDTIHVAPTYDASVEGPLLIGKDITIEGDGGRAKLPAFGILGEHTLELRNATVAGTYTSEEGDTASIYQLGGGLVLDDVVFTSTKSTAVAAAFTWVDAKEVVATGFTTKPVFHFYVADVHIESGRFEKNQRNAIVALSSNLVVTGSVFTDNTDLVDETPVVDDLAHAPAGADILAVRSAVTLDTTSHTGSSAAYGGAVLVVDGTLDVEGSSFRGTQALLAGGAIAMAQDDTDGDGVTDGPGTRFHISETDFTESTAGAGGALAILGGDGELADVDISDTHAVQTELYGGTEDELVAGGAIAADGARIDGVRVAIFGTDAAEVGGGMLLTSSEATFYGLQLDDGEAQLGGGIATFDSSLRVYQSTLTGNTAAVSGGGILAVSPTILSVASTSFCGDEAPEGAALMLYRGSPTILEMWGSSVIGTFGGPAVTVRSDDTTVNTVPFRIQNVTFADNFDWSVAAYAGEVKLLNGLVTDALVGLTAGDEGQLYADYTGYYDVITPSTGIVEGAGMVADADPKWENGPVCWEPLYLGPGSPARDAGDPEVLDADGSPSDLGAYGGGIVIPDGDGDGSLADQDCDDTRPDVFPGAPEIWYDGVDQDCAGGDDDDQDGDGYALFAGDCDDRDPLRNPDTVEIENDRIDQDCDGLDNGDFEWLNGGGGCATAGVGRASVPASSGLLLLLLGRRRR
jgi:hypothetical protein